MRLVDTHTHIFSSEFDYDRAEAINRAKQQGVMAMVLPNIDSQSVEPMLAVAHQFPNYCFPCMGLHPTSVGQNFEKELLLVEEYLGKQKFYAVGEIGIDLYWDKTYIEQQREVFRHQLKLAKKYALPVIIHARNSFPEIFEIVDQENDLSLRGVFHSFTGTLDDYKHIAEYGGFLVGLGGVVTYKNGGVNKVVPHMDISHILVETDSPYLSPVPLRGKRNESANLTHIVNKIGELLSLPLHKVANLTTQNALELFSIPNL